jgi:toxin ParE1/3/4
MKVVWSESALAQLDRIFAYIARDNPSAAKTVAQRIRATAALLGNSPRLGRATDQEGVFVLAMSRYPYFIFYRISKRDGHVRIIRVRHTARRRLNPA